MPYEDEEQAALIEWADWAATKYPELRRLFHIPNGGHRDRVVAAKLVGQGVRPGVLDLMLPSPRGHYHGAWIEMKSLTGRTSAEQRDWIIYLDAAGYFVRVCKGFEAARDTLLEYLALPIASRACARFPEGGDQ